jgi:hypothetical protein
MSENRLGTWTRFKTRTQVLSFAFALSLVGPAVVRTLAVPEAGEYDIEID